MNTDLFCFEGGPLNLLRASHLLNLALASPTLISISWPKRIYVTPHIERYVGRSDVTELSKNPHRHFVGLHHAVPRFIITVNSRHHQILQSPG